MIGNRPEGGPLPREINTTARYERFFMPSIYQPDSEWGKVMEDSVSNAVEYIEQHPDVTFEQLLEVIIATARQGLQERATKYTKDEERDVKINAHAKEFGVLRTGSQRMTSIGDSGPLSTYKNEGIEVLKQFGVHKQEQDVWGQFSSRAGQPFTKEKYVLQHTYETPKGLVELCEVKADWIPTHDEAHVRKPFRKIDIASPLTEVVEPMLEGADVIFKQLREIEEKIKAGTLERDERTLATIVEKAAELYWILSQTWPYKRGSAGIADLSTKAVFDWLKIHTPLWKDTANPNITALLNPLEEFRKKYESLYQERLHWEGV